MFLELAAIPSPPGEERAVADVVLRYLRDLGLERGRGRLRPARSARRWGTSTPGSSRRRDGTPLFFCAHLDTVPPSGPLEPVVEDGVVRNAGGTILGADNKSAVVAMLEGVRRVLAESRPHAGIELLFTPKEEVGLIGAYAFDHDRLHARARLRLRPGGADRRDHPRRAVVAGDARCTFHGRAAHSGMFPEEGRSAIQAAAKAIADLRLGRVDEETTANVGVIDGGTGGQHRPRVVHVPRRGALARRARSSHELRAGDARRVHVRGDGDATARSRRRLRKSYRGYRFKRDDDVVRLAATALERCGYEPTLCALGRRRRRERLQRARAAAA